MSGVGEDDGGACLCCLGTYLRLFVNVGRHGRLMGIEGTSANLRAGGTITPLTPEPVPYLRRLPFSVPLCCENGGVGSQ